MSDKSTDAPAGAGTGTDPMTIEEARDATADRHDRMRVLGGEECAELLRRHRLGRVALSHEGHPTIFPVNYLYDGTSLVIRTAPGIKLDEAPFSSVAFEIDDAEPSGQWGWSVLVEGPCSDVTTAIDELSEHLRELPVQPWVPGERQHWLKITARRISGRAFGQPRPGER